MSHPSARVRRAASSAYVEVCRTVSPEALPRLLHESFLIHLQDTFVVVHQAAVGHLRGLALPQPYRDRAFECVLGIVHAYRDKADEHGRFLGEALSQLLKLMPDEWPQADALRALTVDVARNLPQDCLQRFLQRSAETLSATPGIGDLILVLPFRGDRPDYGDDIFLEHLRSLPREEVGRIADRLVGIGAAAAGRSPLAATPIVEILDQHGQTVAARRLAATAVESAGSDRSKLPDKLRMSVYAKALEVEIALQDERFDDLIALSNEIRRLEGEVEEDDRVNADRRRFDVFP